MWTTCFVRSHSGMTGGGVGAERALAQPGCRECRRHIVFRDNAELHLRRKEIDRAKFGFTQARGILQHRLENWLQFTRRAADDLQHLRGRGLLLQRLAAAR